MATISRAGRQPQRQWQPELMRIRRDYGTTAADLAQALSQSVEGEVRFDSASRSLYATDLSIYRQAPVGVVIGCVTGREVKFR